MKTGTKSVFVIAAIALSTITITSVFADPVGEAATSEQGSEPEGGSYSARQVTWNVTSDSDAKVAVVAIGLSEVIPVKPGFSLVWVNEGYAATDYGPYNRLFLVYHSEYEMPHYEATFFLGSIHSVVSVELLDDQRIQIETNLHARLMNPGFDPVSPRVRMVVDLSEVNAMVQDPPEKEGNLDVSVGITIAESF